MDYKKREDVRCGLAVVHQNENRLWIGGSNDLPPGWVGGVYYDLRAPPQKKLNSEFHPSSPASHNPNAATH